MTSNVAPTGLARELRERAGFPIRIGLVGSGEMGTDIVTRAAGMDGIEVAAICEHRPAAAHAAVELARGEGGHSIDAGGAEAVDAAMENGKVAVTEDAEAIVNSGLVDVIVDATGIPDAAAEFGLRAMECGKHLVMMNVEADVTVGSYLRREADRLGVVYSLGAGDEPSACMELIEFASAMGHEIVCAGKGKNNPLRFDATPDQYEREARRRNMNPRLLVEFVDGSKTMVEMTAIANATGLVPDRAGMHGLDIGPEDLATAFVPERDGGVLADAGRVDFITGKGLAPGVFAVIHAEHPRIRERMTDLKMGDGPYYSLVRPYHLTSLEVPLTCARAVLRGTPDMVPLDRPVAEACAVAKRDLRVGDRFDQIGEYSFRAWIMEAEQARAARAVPAGLLAGAKVTRAIARGELVTMDNADLQEDSRIVELRRRQDRAIFGNSPFDA